MKRFITLLSAAALALSCIVSPQTAEAATGDPAAINYVDTMYKNMNGASSMGMKFDTSLVYGIAAGSPVSDAVRM